MGGQIIIRRERAKDQTLNKYISNTETPSFHVATRLLRCHYAILRSLLHVIETEEFQVLYDSASKEDQQKIVDMIKQEDITTLREWVKTKRYTILELIPIRQLRIIAQQQSIPRYSRSSRAELLRRLQKGVKE